LLSSASLKITDATDARINQSMKKPPSKKITPRAIRVWQLGAAISNLFYFVAPAIYFSIFGHESYHFWVLIGITSVLIVYWFLGVLLIPYLRWKKWRYSYDQHEIDLKRGVIVTKRTLIPLSRVQHVDTRQGPLLRWYKLASVTISTAATTHEIPALDEDVANSVRDTISKFARLAEEDV
jgi:membrane protein YdbS with pleckstrin-like domain